jgi:hypothetical protein
MITSTNTSSIENQTSKLSFPNSSSSFTLSQATTSTNSNSAQSNATDRYSPSNFYRAAAVAAATSDSNNRRYMPSASVNIEEEKN